MKIRVSKADIALAIKKCASVVKNHSPIPILSCVVLEPNRMTGTSLEQEVTVGFPCVMTDPGKVAIPLSRLSEIVATIPDDGEVSISCTTERATITSGGKRFSVGVQDHESLPIMNLLSGATAVSVAYDDLYAILKTVDFAAPKDDVRHYLNGVYLTAGGGRLRAVATNGHILGVAECQCDVSDADVGVIIPKDAVRTILRLSYQSTQKVSMLFLDDAMVVRIGDDSVSLRGLSGKFPEYGRVIPRECDKTMIVDRDALIHAIEAAAVCAVNGMGSVKMSATHGSFTILGVDPDGGDESDVTIPVEYNGDDIEITASHRYCVGALRSMRCETVHMSMTSPTLPMLFENHENNDVQYVVMPTRI
jgi:DNA polymerase III subunit beta